MKTISVHSPADYDVHIGAGLLGRSGALLAPLLGGAETAAVLTDDNVELLYLDRLAQSLAGMGLRVCSMVLPHGETSKNGGQYLRVLEFLSDEGLTRADVLLALGGGMIGDLGGFAAATYLRGIRCVQVPTTLLAMVDASVGAKCAIDLPNGKNIAGAFYPPVAVLADLNCLQTLPQEEFRSGCGEVLKYAVLGDRALFDRLLDSGAAFDRETVIADCVAAKARFVEADAFDRGRRALLNLGHTVGHAVEKHSGYAVSHGAAVAMGLGVMARAAAAHGDCPAEDAARIAQALTRLGVSGTPDCAPEALFPYLRADKKRRGDEITLAVIRGIGRCALRRCTMTEAENYLKAGF